MPHVESANMVSCDMGLPSLRPRVAVSAASRARAAKINEFEVALQVNYHTWWTLQNKHLVDLAE